MTDRKPSRSSRCSAAGRGRALGRREVVRAAHGDGGMSPVRESDDEIGVEPPAEADDLDASDRGGDDADG